MCYYLDSIIFPFLTSPLAPLPPLDFPAFSLYPKDTHHLKLLLCQLDFIFLFFFSFFQSQGTNSGAKQVCDSKVTSPVRCQLHKASLYDRPYNPNKSEASTSRPWTWLHLCLWITLPSATLLMSPYQIAGSLTAMGSICHYHSSLKQAPLALKSSLVAIPFAIQYMIGTQ